MGTLVTVDWLLERLGDPTVRVLDCTVHLVRGERGYERVSGRADWAAAHVPGSLFADLITDLSEPDTALAFMRPSAERFAAAMEALGVGDDTTVVLYDSRGSMWATRLWWLLRSFGFDHAHVLDGGWAAWTAAGAATTDATVAPPAASFTARPRPELFVDADRVAAIVDHGGACLIDSLMPEQYRGEVSAYARPGHIPGALNVPAMHLVDPATGRFKPVDELRSMFADQLASGAPIVTYCGGGIAATADAFVLTLLGHRDVAVYDGSLSEWTADPSRPMTTG
jgi:thiosulfate/3-mercaptopyruvate sulfurtransferase